MNTLMTAIVLWLSVNFGMPPTHDYPRVEFVPPATMAALRFRGLASDRSMSLAADSQVPDAWQGAYALYDDTKRVIYLYEEWTGATAAELSVLVHEMVHHLQSVGGLKYNCPQEREKPAYEAQSRWLALFGRSLEDDFEIDPMTVLIRTNCLY
jgi:hypothetical protein